MAQFDLFRNKAGPHPPYLLVVQSDLLHMLDSVVVVPLIPAALLDNKTIAGLFPVFDINAIPHIVLTTQIAGISPALLGEKVASLAQHHHQIMSALDFLFTGV